MNYLKEFLEIREAFDYISFDALAYLAVAVVLFAIGKVVNDILTPYNINQELGDKDNKALAVSYTGYLVGQGIIIVGVLLSPGKGLVSDLIATGIWGLAGILLLNLSRIINDTLILSKFNNVKEIIEDKNIGTGAAQFGSYVGIAFIISAVIQGESEGLVGDILGTAIFYILAQICFIIFGITYQKVTSYDFHAEIEKDNAAAGVAFGLSLTAIGIVISHIIPLTNSLAAFGIWFINGLFLILLARWLVDKAILPKHKLDEEISRDQNWGVALIEGSSAIVVAFLINACFA